MIPPNPFKRRLPAVVLLVLVGLAGTALVVLAGAQSSPTPEMRSSPSPAADAAKEKLKTYRAATVRRGVARFKLRVLNDFTIRRGVVRVGDARQRVSRAALRSGARRHRLAVGLSRRLREARRKLASGSAVPVLAIRTTGRLIPARGALLGAVHGSGGDWSPEAMLRFETAIGRRLDIDHHYHAWGSDYWPSRTEGDDVAKGRVPMLSLGGAPEFPGLDAVISGSQDRFLRGAARRVKRFGSQLFLRPLWEMNGDWSPWDGTHNDGPANYVAAWRRMHDIFVRAGATNAVWVWSPNCSDNPDVAWNHWTHYYPGDAYVDWVACDGYNRGALNHWSQWESFESIFGGSPSVYADYPNKPFMVAETGSCELGGSKARWIRDAAMAIESRLPRVKAVVWFNIEKDCDWRVNSSRSSLAAFRSLATDPHFNP